MKKLLCIITAIIMIVTAVPLAFAAEKTRTVYLIVTSNYTGENEPFTVYLHTDDSIYTSSESGYTEKIVLETDYQGNVPTADSPNIYKVSFSDEYTHLIYKGNYHGSSVLTLSDASVYADSYLEAPTPVNISPEELPEVTLIEASNEPTVVNENEKAVIISTEYFGAAYGSTNNGTVLFAYTRNPFINNGTVLGGYFEYIENYGTISGGIFGYSVKNHGTIYGGDYSDSSAVIYNFEGATVSDSVKENAFIVSPQPVSINLTKLTHNAQSLVTDIDNFYRFDITADEGYRVPDTISVTVDGKISDKFTYNIGYNSKSASVIIWDTAMTGAISITAAAEEAVFVKIGNLALGTTEIVSRTVLKQTSGENWSYNAETNTLTLDNFELITTGESEPGLYCDSDLNIVLKGENTIDISASTETDDAAYIDGNLSLSGTENDSLTLKSSSYPGRSKRGLHVDEALEVSGCKLYAYGGESVYSYGIYADALTLKDNASVTGVSEESTGMFNYGIAISDTITVDSGTVTGIGDENTEDSTGIKCDELVLNSGTLEASGNSEDLSVVWNDSVSIDVDTEIKLLRSTIARIDGATYNWDKEAHKFVCSGHTNGIQTCVGYKCTNCKEYYGEADPDAHFGGEATCKTLKKCDGCGSFYGELDPDNHTWENGSCAECKIVCIHNDDDNDSLCNNCKFFSGKTVNVGDKFEISHHVYVKFVPAVSGRYVLYSVSEGDPKIDVYSTDFDWIAYSDDVKTDEGYITDFCLEYDFTAGETYYLEVNDYSGKFGYTVIIECKEHQGGTSDCVSRKICDACGNEYGGIDTDAHDIIIDEAVTPTCSETGLTEGQHCSRCDNATIEQELLPVENHKDNDGDGMCDFGCGTELSGGNTPDVPDEPENPDEPDTPEEPENPDDACDHICHKSGFMGFVWKMINFFLRLFNIQQYCDCGILHYDAPLFG